MCRRSPPACDRRHIRQPVPAARFTAVLPRGSGGDTGGARRNRQGLGTQRKDRCSGVRSLEVPVRSAVAHRRDPSASLTRPAPSRPERAWPFAVDWRVLLARSRRPVLPDLGTARRVNPEPKDPKDGLTRLDGPGTSRLATARPGVDGCHVPAAGGAVRLRATVSTDAGTRVRMMRTRSARPRAIRSASPVGSWPTASCRRGPWSAW
jgi:hypothetical protein